MIDAIQKKQLQAETNRQRVIDARRGGAKGEKAAAGQEDMTDFGTPKMAKEEEETTSTKKEKTSWLSNLGKAIFRMM